MQEVGGSIPPGSTTLRLRLRVAQPRKNRRRNVPGEALLGEDGLAAAIDLLFGFAWRSHAGAETHGSIAKRNDGLAMWHVYIIRSIDFPDQEYTGATADLRQRISDHNAGKSAHTAKFKPRELVLVLCFPKQVQSAGI